MIVLCLLLCLAAPITWAGETVELPPATIAILNNAEPTQVLSEYGSAVSLNIAALGRSFELGYLYNKKTDTLIDANLWNLTEFNENTVSHKSSVFSDWRVVSDDTIIDRVNNMDIDVNLKMSIMGGLIKIKGMAGYLENRKQNSRVSSLTLTAKKRSCTLKM